MTEIEDYELYIRCKVCGQILTDWEIDNNNELCNFCYDDVNCWREFPVGCNLNMQINYENQI